MKTPYLAAVAAAALAAVFARRRRQQQVDTELLWREATSDASR